MRFAYQDESSFEKRFEEIIMFSVGDGYFGECRHGHKKTLPVLNYRYLNKLATVITSNYHLNDFEARLRSACATRVVTR